MKDKNGKTIKVGMEVDVPEPNGNDMYNFEFRGSVHSFHDEYVTIEDMESNFFDIEPERLEIVEEQII
jgi:hypothetical protein